MGTNNHFPIATKRLRTKTIGTIGFILCGISLVSGFLWAMTQVALMNTENTLPFVWINLTIIMFILSFIIHEWDEFKATREYNKEVKKALMWWLTMEFEDRDRYCNVYFPDKKTTDLTKHEITCIYQNTAING